MVPPRALADRRVAPWLLGLLAALALALGLAAPASATSLTNTANPQVSGTLQEGSTVTTSNGVWTGGKTPYTYQYWWFRCSTSTLSFSSCSLISGANDTSYTLTSADVGKYVGSIVEATDARGVHGGSNSFTAYGVTSPPVGPVLPLPPSNTLLPHIAGSPAVGVSLSTSDGTWISSAAYTVSYQWLDCDYTGLNCQPISGATASSYTVTASDLQGSIRVAVTARNAGGSTTVQSDPAGQQGQPQTVTQTVAAGGSVQTPPPSQAVPLQVMVTSPNAGPVSISLGTPTQVAPQGTTWLNYQANISAPDATVDNPLVLTFDIAPAGLPAAGAQGVALWRYGVEILPCQGYDTVDDQGNVTATFTPPDPCVSSVKTLSDGTAEIVVRTSHASPYNATAKPANATRPAVSDNQGHVPPVVGDSLTGTVGTWDGTSAPLPTSYVVQWQRCNAQGSGCKNVGSATTQFNTNNVTRPVVAGDVPNTTLRLSITARNANGTTQVFSDATGVVRTAPPILDPNNPPQVLGNPIEGGTLTATTGLWSSQFIINYNFQWQLCDQSGQNCSDIPGATGSSYVVQSGDVGHSLRIEVQAYNTIDGVAAAYSPSTATAQVKPLAPVSTGAPQLSGVAQESQILTTSNGSWNTTHIDSYNYQWQRSTDNGQSWSDIQGATSQSYALQAADVLNKVRAQVTAVNVSGSASAVTDASQTILPLPPVLLTAPQVSGVAVEGQTLSATSGSFTSSAPLSYAYQWQMDQGQGFSDIKGATSSSYTLSAAQIGANVRVVVTATNAGGSTQGSSSAVGPVLPLPPSNASLPVISGQPREGKSLSLSNGSWVSSVPLTYSYQWLRCDASGASCVAIAGDTAASHSVSAADFGHQLAAVVTASDSYGQTSSATALSVGPVLPISPSAGSTSPQISGAAQESQPLTVDNGSFTSSVPLTYTYQWQLCDASGSNCQDVAGATSQTYTVPTSSIGQVVQAVVTATDPYGQSTSATSGQVGPVLPLPPLNSGLPQLSGTAQEGKTLSASTGDWTSSTADVSYSYQWLSCDAQGLNCTAIAGATSQTYTLTSSDVDNTVRVTVSACNAGGCSSASSDPSAVSLPAVPAETALPVTSGTAVEGQTISTSDGSWTKSPSSYSYQWYRCDLTGANCTAIPGATSSSYTLTSSDVSQTLRAGVVATNKGGSSAEAQSDPTAEIWPLPPVNLVPPAANGVLVEGQTLHTVDGSWQSAVVLNYTYQWQRCDNGDASGARDPKTAAQS